MKKVWIAIIVLFALVMACESDWCQGTKVHKPKSYTETKGKTEPYYEMGKKPFYIPMGCSSYECSFNAQVYVNLFNPTKREVKADVECGFKQGDYLAGTSKKDNITIPAATDLKGTMRRVDMTQQLSVQKGSDPEHLEISCHATFH